MSIISGVLHTVDTRDRKIFLFQDFLDFSVTGDGIVIGEGKGVHMIIYQKINQFPAGKYCIRFCSVVM